MAVSGSDLTIKILSLCWLSWWFHSPQVSRFTVQVLPYGDHRDALALLLAVGCWAAAWWCDTVVQQGPYPSQLLFGWGRTLFSVPFGCFIIFLFFWVSQLVNIFLSSCHSDLAHFSSIHSDGGHVPVLFFKGSDVTITAHTVKYTPQGTLHGNHKVALSRGYVKCNITQRGHGHQKKGQLFSTVLMEEPAVSCFPQSDNTIGICASVYFLTVFNTIYLLV